MKAWSVCAEDATSYRSSVCLAAVTSPMPPSLQWGSTVLGSSETHIQTRWHSFGLLPTQSAWQAWGRGVPFFFSMLLNCVFIFAFFYWLPEKHAWTISLTRAVHWLACGNKGSSRREIDPTCNLMYWGLWFSCCLLRFTWWYQPCLVTSLSVLHAVCSCAFSGSSKLHDALMSLMLGSLCWPGSVYGCFCSFV